MADVDLKQLDAVSRRRLQNRLNQQASRKRKALEKQSKGQTKRWVVYTDEARPLTRNKCQENKTVGNRRPRLETPSKDYRDKDNATFCPLDQRWRGQYFQDLQMNFAKGNVTATTSLQRANMLLSVSQLNTMRAMIANAATMGLSVEVLCDDIASHFNISGPYQVTMQLPSSLQPSSSQKQIIHHPWIDLIPIESLRDSLLTKMGVYDEDELCIDFCGFDGDSPEVGLLVWGESWDPSGYEITEKFFKKWNWLLKDCVDLIQSTNYWRRQRGERPLKVETNTHQIREVE